MRINVGAAALMQATAAASTTTLLRSALASLIFVLPIRFPLRRQRLRRRPSHLRERLPQGRDSPRHVLLHADCDAHITIASRVGRTVPQQHATLTHRRYELL